MNTLQQPLNEINYAQTATFGQLSMSKANKFYPTHLMKNMSNQNGGDYFG